MPINPGIALQQRAPTLGSLANGFADDLRNQRRQDQLDSLAGQKLELDRQNVGAKMQANKLKALTATQKRSAEDAARLALSIKQNPEQAVDILTRHKQMLNERIAAGEPINTTDTDRMLEQARTNPQALLQDADREIEIATRFGVLEQGPAKFEQVMVNGRPVQRDTRTGKLVADPTAPKPPNQLAQSIASLANAQRAAQTEKIRADTQARQDETRRANENETKAKRAELVTKRRALQDAGRQAKRAKTLIDRIRSKAGEALAVGGGSELLSKLGGTAARDIRSDLTTLKGLMTFNQLLSVQSQGAKLGILSDSDMNLLGAIGGNLDQGQSAGQLLENLQHVESLLGNTVDRANEELGITLEALGQKPKASAPQPLENDSGGETVKIGKYTVKVID